MQIVMLFVLAIATSLDSLGVGVIYGLGGIRVRPAAHLCICAVMMAITWTAVAVGNNISRYLSESVTKVLGAVVFAGIGLWILAPLLRRKQGTADTATANPSDHAPSALEVLDNPHKADRDGSRDIDLREAFLLGIALSLNNIFGGISAGLIRISPLGMASLSVFFNVVCLVCGHLLGKSLHASRLSRHAQALSGILMILVGLWQLH